MGLVNLRSLLSGYAGSVRHPAGFHGASKPRNFFEGWYIKLVSANEAHRLALIPGIFLGPTGQAQAFVQVLDGTSSRSWYHEFDRSSFHADEREFDIRVGNNSFSDSGVALDLPDLTGTVTFSSPLHPWPITSTSPGIMGPFGWVPAMECYHGLVSFDHELVGSLHFEGADLDFTGGRGYIEKDWGQAFPAAYVWMQTNNFPTPGTSLSASIAHIPWSRTSFRGFIVGLWHNGVLHKFATYTGAKTRVLKIEDHEVRWSMTSTSGTHLSLTADRATGTLLHAPIRTEMHRRVEETLDATIRVRLTDRNGDLLFDEVGTCAGLEVHGDLERLTVR